MQDKLFKLTIPTLSTLLLIISTLIGAVGYFYSLDKRVSLVEQNMIHIEQDKIELEKQVQQNNSELEKQVEQNNNEQEGRQTRLEDKLDKIYEILMSRNK